MSTKAKYFESESLFIFYMQGESSSPAHRNVNISMKRGFPHIMGEVVGV